MSNPRQDRWELITAVVLLAVVGMLAIGILRAERAARPAGVAQGVQ
jgi:hypothetical protein